MIPKISIEIRVTAIVESHRNHYEQISAIKFAVGGRRGRLTDGCEEENPKFIIGW